MSRPPGDGATVTTRRLLTLAASAFAVLAAEPLYLLVDTAVVGHLGSTVLASLGIGAALLGLVTLVGTFLEYGTTSRAARWYGAGRRDDAVREGVQATWLALVIGAGVVVVTQIVATPLTRALSGGDGPVAHGAETWLRIAVFGVPGVLVTLAGNGWLRGVQETRTPVLIVLAANGLSAAASPVLVYPLGLGLAGSAVANVAAQAVATVLFLRALARTGVDRRPDRAVMRAQLTMGRDLFVRVGRVPGRVPHRGRRRRPHGHGAARRAPDRPAAVGVHRAAVGLVRHRRASFDRRRARRRRHRQRPGTPPGGWRDTGCGPASRSGPRSAPVRSCCRRCSPIRRR